MPPSRGIFLCRAVSGRPPALPG